MTVRSFGDSKNKKRFDKPLGRFVLADDLTVSGEIPVADAYLRVVADWDRQVEAGQVSQHITYTYASLMKSFVGYCDALGIQQLGDVTPTVVLEWMHSATEKGEAPANSTRLGRRTVARTFFATAQCLGLYDENPAMSVVEHRRSERHVHAFTDAEIAHLKQTAEHRLGEHKTPTMLALMLLGATSREVAHIRLGDVDLEHNRVWLHGGAERNRPRWVPIDDAWARQRIIARIAAIAKERPGATYAELAPVLLAYRPIKPPRNPNRRAASVVNSMDRLLRMTRVYVPGETRLESIREHLALRVYQETGRLEAVAVRLGLSSLDTIAHLVGADWVSEFAPDATPPAVDGETW